MFQEIIGSTFSEIDGLSACLADCHYSCLQSCENACIWENPSLEIKANDRIAMRMEILLEEQ